MKMFAVAYTDFFNNDLQQKIVFAESEIDAMKKELKIQGYNFDDYTDIGTLKSDVFGSDAQISAIEVVIV